MGCVIKVTFLMSVIGSLQERASPSARLPCGEDRSSGPWAPLSPPRRPVRAGSGAGSVRAAVSGRESSLPLTQPFSLNCSVSRTCLTCCAVLPSDFTKRRDSGRRVEPYLTLPFPFPQGWIRRCLPSAGLPSLLLLPRATTAGGPQGHAMSATGQVRHRGVWSPFPGL